MSNNKYPRLSLGFSCLLLWGAALSGCSGSKSDEPADALDVDIAMDSLGCPSLSDRCVPDIRGRPDDIQDSGTDLARTDSGSDLVCSAALPHLWQGLCVECIQHADCESDRHCNTSNHTCETTTCSQECCHCLDPFGACTQSMNVWLCVACTDDSGCGAGGSCDPVRLTCLGTPVPTPVCPGCIDDGDCWDPLNNYDLKCEPNSGCCFNTLGRCDNAGAMCVGEDNSSCVPIQQVWTGDLPQSQIQASACSCTDPWDGTPQKLAECLPDGCPDDGCLGATLCVDSSTALAAGVPVDFEGGLCLDITLFVAK